MKSSLVLAALLSTVVVSLKSEGAEPAAPPGPEAVVEKKLLEPLAARERHQARFSRSPMPAVARRVRLPGAAPSRDSADREFVAFAVDARSGWALDDENAPPLPWRKDTITGCVYLDRGEVFVKRREAFFPVEVMLGKKVKAAEGAVCTPRGDPVATAK